MIQEHWLFTSQLSLLDLDTNFCSFGVSGMADDVILQGRPYGGCGIIFRKTINVLKTPSMRFCAALFIYGNESLLLLSVYLPTDYHSESSDADYDHSLSEISGFVDSLCFDHIVIGGDFNTSSNSTSLRCSQLEDFMLGLLAWTILRKKRRSRDIVACSQHIVEHFSEVYTR